MSEMEHWIGRAVEIGPNENETLEQACDRILIKEGGEKSKYDDTFQEALEDHSYKKIVIANDKIYDVSDKRDYETEDVVEAHLNPDGTIRFQLRFYNGGAGFQEVFEESLNKMKADE